MVHVCNLYINIGRSVRTVSEGRTAGMPTDCIDKTMSHCQVMLSRIALRPHTAIFGGRHSPRSALRL